MQAQALIREGKLSAALAALQDQVRADAAKPQHRIFLFQLLCVLGQWHRALTQLNVAGELDAAALPMVQTYREAIQCEALRGDIFKAVRAPLIFGMPPAWLAWLQEAIKLDAAGDMAGAAGARAHAFDAAPACGGAIDGQRFAWLADADARLGPVFEVILNGRYFWVPAERIRRIVFDPPTDLRDVVWTPASFTWTNGAETVGLVPTRYADTTACTDAAVLLARRTEWTAAGHGLGQRMFVTDAGDYPLMDVRTIAFDVTDADLNTDANAAAGNLADATSHG
jgi:type VI secretion system protein ImpE